MTHPFDEYDEIADFPLLTIDEIWEQWNQSNELSSDTNLPNSVKNRRQDADVVSVVEVFDSDFKHLYEIPSHMVVHVPSARLNITRLVLCRNYKPGDPDSCAMGANCKFVHVNVDYLTLDAHPIHVNYVWQHEDSCTYRRLQPGETVEVLSADSRSVEVIPSERILVTRGSIARHDIVEPLIRCKYYDASQICYTGERCNFVHVVFVDPNIQGLFKRAPKVLAEPRDAAPVSPSGNKTNYFGANNTNNGSGGSGNVNFSTPGDPNAVPATSANGFPLSGGGGGGGAGADGSSAAPPKWVPNIASPSFEPTSAAAALPLPLLQGLGLSPALSPAPPAARALSPAPAQGQAPGQAPAQGGEEGGSAWEATGGFGAHPPGAFAAPATLHSACAAMEKLLPQLRSQSRGVNAEEAVEEKLAHVLSCVASLLTQRTTHRNVMVAASPLLDDSSALGTLLFLPRGNNEAVALQSVHDAGLLGVIAALGAQKRDGIPAAPASSLNGFYPHTVNGVTSNNLPNNTNDNAGDLHTKHLLYELQRLPKGRNGNGVA